MHYASKGRIIHKITSSLFVITVHVPTAKLIRRCDWFGQFVGTENIYLRTIHTGSFIVRAEFDVLQVFQFRVCQSTFLGSPCTAVTASDIHMPRGPSEQPVFRKIHRLLLQLGQN